MLSAQASITLGVSSPRIDHVIFQVFCLLRKLPSSRTVCDLSQDIRRAVYDLYLAVATLPTRVVRAVYSD